MTSEEGQTCRWKCEPQVKGAIWRIFCVSDEFFTPSEHSAIVATGILNALEAQVTSLQQQVRDLQAKAVLADEMLKHPESLLYEYQHEAWDSVYVEACRECGARQSGNDYNRRPFRHEAHCPKARYDALAPDTGSEEG